MARLGRARPNRWRPKPLERSQTDGTTTVVTTMAVESSVVATKIFSRTTTMALASSVVVSGRVVRTTTMALSSSVTTRRTGSSSPTSELELFSSVAIEAPEPPPAVELPTIKRTPPVTTPYEVVCVARIPQSSGPPLLIEVDPIDWTGLSFTDELSKPQTLDAGCQITNLTEAVLQRLRHAAELATELWVYRAGKLVFAGPLLGGLVQGEGLSLRAVGLLGYLRLMFATTDLVFAQVDQLQIVTALIDHWQNQPYGNFGIDTSGVSPSGFLRDATYLAKELHPIGQRVEELGARQNGFDIAVDPSSRKLELAYPQRGVDRSEGEDALVFDSRNVTSPNIAFSVAPGDVASAAFGTGTSTVEGTLYSVKANSDLMATYGRAGIAATFDGVSLHDTLDAHVQGMLDARGEALLIPGPDVRVTPDSDLLAYDVGDTVKYQLHSRLGIEGAFRLRKRQVTVSKTGQERVSFQFV